MVTHFHISGKTDIFFFKKKKKKLDKQANKQTDK